MGYEVLILGDNESSDAICSFLHTTLTHMGEFQVKLLEVISREFKISIDKLVETIRDAPEFQKEVLQNIQKPPIKTKRGNPVTLVKF